MPIELKPNIKLKQGMALKMQPVPAQQPQPIVPNIYKPPTSPEKYQRGPTRIVNSITPNKLA